MLLPATHSNAGCAGDTAVMDMLSSAVAFLQDVLLGLKGVYNTTKTENVKATTASTISRMLRSNPELLPVLLENSGVQLILRGTHFFFYEQCRVHPISATLAALTCAGLACKLVRAHVSVAFVGMDPCTPVSCHTPYVPMLPFCCTAPSRRSV